MDDFIHRELYSPWLVGIASSCLRDFFIQKGVKRAYKKNEYLISHEQPIKRYWLIDSGWCHYSASFKEDKDSYMSLYLPGSTFISISEYMSGFIQAGANSKVYELSAEIMREKMMENVHNCANTYTNISFSFASAAFGQMLNNQFDVEERIAVFLQMLALRAHTEVAKGYYTIGCRMSHEYIHNFVNANRVTVSKIMGNWRKDGIIIYVNNIVAVSKKLYTANIYR
jgi:CRP-like cAMP-binding protein